MKADYGWVGLTVYVAAYDVWACWNGHESLSGAFWRGMNNSKARIPMIAGTIILMKHLLKPDLLPQVDPLRFVGSRLRNHE